MRKYSVKETNLLLLSIKNLLLVAFIHIFAVFYHPYISIIREVLDAFQFIQTGLNSITNFKERISNIIHWQMFLDKTFVKRAHILTVEKKTLTLVPPFLWEMAKLQKELLEDVVKLTSFLKAKEVSRISSVYFMTLCLVFLINFCVVDETLLFMVRHIGTWK